MTVRVRLDWSCGGGLTACGGVTSTRPRGQAGRTAGGGEEGIRDDEISQYLMAATRQVQRLRCAMQTQPQSSSLFWEQNMCRLGETKRIAAGFASIHDRAARTESAW